MKKVIKNNEDIPWGYRIAYIDYAIPAAVTYPIGVHLIAMASRRVWEWSFRYRQSAFEDYVRTIYGSQGKD